MLKSNLNLGFVLNKTEQKIINGGKGIIVPITKLEITDPNLEPEKDDR